VLIFRENSRRQEERAQAAIRAAVAAGRIDPVKAWPDIFGKPSADGDEAFPHAGADMSGFTWEQPDQERISAELEQLMRGARVQLTGTGDEPPAMPPPPREPQVRLRPGAPPPVPVPGDPASLEWG
jgi:hypothetical protein